MDQNLSRFETNEYLGQKSKDQEFSLHPFYFNLAEAVLRKLQYYMYLISEFKGVNFGRQNN